MSKKIMNRSFQKRLNNLVKILDDKFVSINSGGCGHFALTLGNQLKLHTDDVQIVYLYSPKGDLEGVKDYFNECVEHSCLKSFVTSGIPVSHLMVRCNDYLIDSSGVYESFNEFKSNGNDLEIIGDVDFDVVEYWVSSSNWNKDFDIKKMPKLKNLIVKYFNRDLSIRDRLNIISDKN